MNIEGKWKLDDDEEIRAYDQDGALLDNVALVYRAEDFGNLIAAAPELYEALVKARALLLPNADRALADEIDTVLAKARGEQVSA